MLAIWTWPDNRHHLAQPHGDVAMNDLAVIDVELQFQVRDLQFGDQVAREAKIVEKIARHVACVDRLDHDVEAVGREELRGPRHRFVELFDRPRIAAIGDARHQMQPLDAGCLRVRQRRLKASLQIVEAIRQRGKAFFAGVPIARRQVEQRLRQAVAFQPFADGICRMVIGKQEFDGRKARVGRRVEAVEERDFGEHHGEIGGKSRHRTSPF